MASKERAPVSRASRPQSVPPPRDVPPTRSKVRGEVTLRDADARADVDEEVGVRRRRRRERPGSEDGVGDGEVKTSPGTWVMKKSRPCFARQRTKFRRSDTNRRSSTPSRPRA